MARAIERPTEGGPSIDAMLEASSASSLDDNGAARDFEIERTPLSSRIALERAAARRTSDRPTPYGETPARPSILIRKRTHRFQNVIAAAALIVIIVLIVWGRKEQRDSASRDDAARAGAAAGASAALASTTTASAAPSSSPSKRPPRPHASGLAPTAPASAATASSDAAAAATAPASGAVRDE